MNTALILVDIQNDYFKGGRMELVGMEQAGSNAGTLLNWFRQNRLPTFHVQHVALKKAATFFLPNTAGVQINESIQPDENETVITKHFPNSFRDTELLDQLKQANIDSVVICGAMSHMCIDATTRAAVDLGFGCTVIHDACATRDLVFGNQNISAAQVHGSFMAALGPAYAKVVGLNEFLSMEKRDEQ